MRHDRSLLRLGACLIVLVAACSSPAKRFSDRTAALGLHADVVSGEDFSHAIYRNWQNGSPGPELHVYLGGDGTPDIAGSPATDPTPRNPLMLRLLALDPTPAVYLGRPCYHGLVQEPSCTSRLWTAERYSERVVSSIAAVARRLVAQGHFERIVWFGHSGGGALAVLLAERFPETAAVVTIGANLDIEAWAEFHGHERLTGSLNPASRTPLPKRIAQVHYFGGEDRVAPAMLVARTMVTSNADVVIVDNFDHVCCWEDVWPDILAGLD